ncbi:Proteolipid protein 2 [Elasticomyces elasticus]|uniref:Proteolipid protein 2 n=1 Tax=Exophiala sideris TaxID=1016849 RepID=A0ABR0J3T5_9EURO|nr:Proteolipid protein 2 [Elasticomyces elasticus]KAK5026994.1 Proteolipid protein 2 [Exophiala sideris]KAK5033998.1 Proteolipid protein 2 [Exophiala sideris]KAK5055728.1 Proteolipid protein 2 [Exophiala sideris]KAK5180940.1 Proteolipid protein 2 [Eurotiomycetes sp. CCFEE 6388]
MDMPDMPVNVPVDDPNADTEWNDILRKHGIIPEKPKDPEPIIQEALLEAAQRAHENRLEDKDLDELAELEDEEDEAFLEQYRRQRLAELSRLEKKSVYGQVYGLQKPDYARDVTDESSKAFVMVNLTASLGTNVEARILTELWREAAVKFGDVKFCQIRADLCIEGYPERNTPTILVYKDGDIKRQVVTLAHLNGPRTNMRDIERLLLEVGAITENDVRLKRKDSDEEINGRNKPTVEEEDDDDDWD